jgi:hypothetical protein
MKQGCFRVKVILSSDLSISASKVRIFRLYQPIYLLIFLRPRRTSDSHHIARRVAAGVLFVTIMIGVGIGAYVYFTGSIQLPFLTRLF